MASCSVCKVDTRYRCIKCQVFICNRNPACHVPVDEDKLPGWKMGSAVALCHSCNNDGRENGEQSQHVNSDQSSQITMTSRSQGENLQSIVGPSTASTSLRQFQFDCASRGFHEYREIWNPRVGDKLDIEQDYGNIHDPFSMAIKSVLRGRLYHWEIVGHIPREISRFCHYFINYGGILEARVRVARYRRSPIPSGGLEIPITLIVKRDRADGDVFRKMKELVEEYYIEPEMIGTSSTFTVENDVDMEEGFEPEDELNGGSSLSIRDEIITLEDDDVEPEDELNGESSLSTGDETMNLENDDIILIDDDDV